MSAKVLVINTYPPKAKESSKRKIELRDIKLQLNAENSRGGIKEVEERLISLR